LRPLSRSSKRSFHVTSAQIAARFGCTRRDVRDSVVARAQPVKLHDSSGRILVCSNKFEAPVKSAAPGKWGYAARRMLNLSPPDVYAFCQIAEAAISQSTLARISAVRRFTYEYEQDRIHEAPSVKPNAFAPSRCQLNSVNVSYRRRKGQAVIELPVPAAQAFEEGALPRGGFFQKGIVEGMMDQSGRWRGSVELANSRPLRPKNSQNTKMDCTG
jgi:hypothetical protein